MVRFQPLITLLLGGVFIGIIIYAAKPSLPVLQALHHTRFDLKGMRHVALSRDAMLWSSELIPNKKGKSVMKINVNSSLDFSATVDGVSLFLIPEIDGLSLVKYRIIEESIEYF